MNSLSFTYGYKLQDLGQVSKSPEQPKCSETYTEFLKRTQYIICYS